MNSSQVSLPKKALCDLIIEKILNGRSVDGMLYNNCTTRQEIPMLAIERRNRILEKLRNQGIITVAEMAAEFSVSEETIRRDLYKMEVTDGVQRTYGGAYIAKAVRTDIPISIRENIYLPGKETIADLCATLVDEGDTVMLDSSTTSIHIADHIKTKRNIVVITNSLKIVDTFANSADVKVICAGGTLRHSQLSFVGPAAERTLEAYYADKAFVSCVGLDMEKGATDADELEAEVRKLMLNNAREKILVADATKFGKFSLSLIYPLDGINVLVTDRQPDAVWLRELTAKKIECLYGTGNPE
jgi:DeoR/GlpR family transcriptional regulator of sugar metabolism